ncbi:hypothetical protein AXF42_Ash007946 [Apostasia shenzhenica]|uniref:Uncharacterized protein n=1 Tax=Apostasia shenzhenica TaxID=1088818 RepID=A0A2I0B5S9_9ASPA|nr:hypothetical protein AXF42_Ash007946 [Apostasia shenzhenica]
MYSDEIDKFILMAPSKSVAGDSSAPIQPGAPVPKPKFQICRCGHQRGRSMAKSASPLPRFPYFSEESAGGDDDEGYRTPTSPRSRIPPAKECPPAPKKPAAVRRSRKRKEGIEICEIGEIGEIVIASREKNAKL